MTSKAQYFQKAHPKIAQFEGRRGLLLAMPMASLNHPAIGLALLKGCLNRAGLNCDIRHLYLDFAEFVGVQSYEAVNDDRYFLALVGEWLFASQLYGENQRLDFEYVSSILLGEYRPLIDGNKLLSILAARKKVPDFIERCIADIDWDAYDFIGFSSSFQQSLASLALAKAIKDRFPTKLIVFGGANCEGEMGIEILRQYPFVDAVIGGEAEISLVHFLEAYFNGKEVEIPGVTTRSGHSAALISTASKPIEILDDLPYLDYEDFTRDRSTTPTVSANYDAVPLFESARGCWWGEKNHCTFCGLNALGMAYRSKSHARAEKEILGLAAKFGREILVVDNILDREYFTSFLPALAEVRPPLLLHYEVKVNLSAEELQLLAKAGVRKIQPGVESLCTEVLKLMRKGTSLLRNVQTLKVAAEAGIYVEWGYLYGFPKESVDGYVEVLKIIPTLTHLSPPAAFTRVRADRFSPYFDTPGDFGVKITPLPAYKYIYRIGRDEVSRLAYHFDMEREGTEEDDFKTVYRDLESALQHWSNLSGVATLSIESQADNSTVTDCRDGRNATSEVLVGCNHYVLVAAVEIVGLTQIIQQLSHRYSAKQIRNSVSYLTAKAFLIREGDSILALPLRQPGWDRSPLKEEIRTSLDRSYFELQRLGERV